MTGEEGVAALNVNQMIADRLEAKLRKRFPDLPELGE